jgi:peptidoglycan/LPS O-acetylase OafA/YrhL
MMQTAAQTVRRRHMPELQSIRGIAALIVLASHCCTYYVVPGWFTLTRMSLANGEASVVVFFVLSGFVLTNQLSRETVDLRSAAVFYVRRLFRIYPALWAASLVALFYVAFIHWRIPVADTSAWFQDRFKAERFTPLGIAASMAGVLAFLLPPVWTIFAELMGSLLMPLIVSSATRVATFLGLGTILAALSFTLGPHTYYGVFVYMLDFWIGAAAFHVVDKAWPVLSPPAAVRAFLMCVAVSTFGWGQFVARSVHDPLIVLAYALAATVLIGGVARSWTGLGFLRTRPLVNLGDWSYSIYLLHFPIMCLVAKAMQLAGAAALDPVVRSLALTAITLAAVIPLSAVSYRFIELPGISLGARAVAELRTWQSKVAVVRAKSSRTA